MMAVEMADSAQSCRACRWHGRTCVGRWTCQLRRRSVHPDAGAHCRLWDPLEGERYPAQIMPRASSSIALCEDRADTTVTGHFLLHLRARMAELGIPTGAVYSAECEDADVDDANE